MQSTRAPLSTSHILIRCHEHVVMTSESVMVSEVCVPAGGGLTRSRRELFAMYRMRAGRSGILCRVSGTDVDWRHDMQNETPRHDRACHATTPKYMAARAHLSHVWHCRDRDTSEAGTVRRNTHT